MSGATGGSHYSARYISRRRRDVKHPEVVASFNSGSGRGSQQERAEDKAETLKKTAGERRKIFEREGEPYDSVYGFRTVKGDDPDYIPLDMLRHLSDGATSVQEEHSPDKKLPSRYRLYHVGARKRPPS